MNGRDAARVANRLGGGIAVLYQLGIPSPKGIGATTRVAIRRESAEKTASDHGARLVEVYSDHAAATSRRLRRLPGRRALRARLARGDVTLLVIQQLHPSPTDLEVDYIVKLPDGAPSARRLDSFVADLLRIADRAASRPYARAS